MTLNEIEVLLSGGFRVGFEQPSQDDEYIGWILVSKIVAKERILELLDEDEAPDLVREQARRRTEPYLLERLELKRSVHEGGDYETESDYRQKDQYWFGSLHEVAARLALWGYRLEDAREARELDAP
jgi:hypothetical protein